MGEKINSVVVAGDDDGGETSWTTRSLLTWVTELSVEPTNTDQSTNNASSPFSFLDHDGHLGRCYRRPQDNSQDGGQTLQPRIPMAMSCSVKATSSCASKAVLAGPSTLLCRTRLSFNHKSMRFREGRSANMRKSANRLTSTIAPAAKPTPCETPVVN